MKASAKRLVPTGILNKSTKQDLGKDDSKSGKAVGRTSGTPTSDRDLPSHASETRQGGALNISSTSLANGSTITASAKGSTSSTRTLDVHGIESKSDTVLKSSEMRSNVVKDDGTEASDVSRPPSRIVHSPRHDNAATASRSGDKLQKRTSPVEETDRLSKRRKGDAESKDFEGDIRMSERERSIDPRLMDLEKAGTDEQSMYRAMDKPLDRSKDKGTERYDRDYRERMERNEKSRGDDNLADKSRDRSMERYGRERSVDRGQDRGTDRNFDRINDKKDERNKDDRGKLRHSDTTEKSHVDERFHGQNLPPPPPLPPHMVPQSVAGTGRREEDTDRRFATTRHAQRLSPRHEEKERRRSEENASISQDDAKRRRDDDFRDRKREDREVLMMKVYITIVDN